MIASSWLAPELLLTPQGDFASNLAVGISDSGSITEVVQVDALGDGAPVRHLSRQALLPGFVNAHSHAFQRSLRGRTEFRASGHEADNFWSWRELMYAQALSLEPEQIYQIALKLFREMLASGYTSVGEFHYLHHRPDGSLYNDPTQLSRVVLQAAADAGIRCCLLVVFYASGGILAPPTPRQRRFISPSFDAFLQLFEPLLHDSISTDHATVGLAPHSIRAVPLRELQRLAQWNTSHALPVHMHICEQTSEVEQSRRLLGIAPLKAIAQTGLLNEHFVGVHATHLEPDDAARLSAAGAAVCACPTTEANLGDGFLPALDLMSAGVPISIGSDSHVVVNPFEELRLIENNERLQRRERNVLAGLMQPDHRAGEALRIAPGLLQSGTLHGANALGLNAGVIAPGALADLIAVDLDDPYLQDVPKQHLPEAIVFSASPRCLTEAWVGGRTRFTSPRPKAK